MVCILAKGSGDCASPAYHDHPPQRLLQNFPDTTPWERRRPQRNPLWSPMGLAAETQACTSLPAGGNEIRTLGPPSRRFSGDWGRSVVAPCAKRPLEDTVRQRVGAPAVPQLDLSCSACHSIEPGAQLVLVW